MIRGMEFGLAQFVKDSYGVILDEIQKNLSPILAPTTRAAFRVLICMLELRIAKYSIECLEDGKPKETNIAYVRALTELKDDISRWLETTEESNNG
jgi:hypothetical protein